jgi:hypothetical protein
MITNGEVRMRVYDGDGKGVFKWVFAGNAHSAFSEGVLRDRAAMQLGNFDYVVQATRKNKINGRRRDCRIGTKDRCADNGC